MPLLLATLPIIRTPGCIVLATCMNMKLFTTISVGQLWVSHHGHILFTLPNQVKTTITHPSNLICDDDVDGEPGGDDGGGDDDDDSDDDDVEEAP